MFLPSFFSTNPLSSPGALRIFLHQGLHIPVMCNDADAAQSLGVLETFLWELQGRDALEIQTVSESIEDIMQSAFLEAEMPEDRHPAVSLDQFEKLVSIKAADRHKVNENTHAEDTEFARICLLRNGLYLQADPLTGAVMYSSADRGSDLSDTYPLTFDHVQLYDYWLEEHATVARKNRERRKV